ncbi:MAG: hypothetical protein KKH52_00300 [Nanoarchaeota archaeon]|nr:hypothetical protein [Nanoarchaeota archaeon]MBU1622662.1 hypothetical protein [Nanoarchaeota archaeon]MBU1973817.1 hypothetical protein [Nanoarchaeota archaeon]
MTKPPPTQTQDFDQAKMYLWVKSLEGKANNLVREINLLKNDFINKNNKLNKEIKTLNTDLTTTRRTLDQTEQKMNLIIKELKKTAGAEEVAVLKKYMEFWNPTTFVTQKDLEKALQQKEINNPKK